MASSARCALFTPISTQQLGNGLAHRARFWQEVLAHFGSVTTVLIPLAGGPVALGSQQDDEIVVPLVDAAPATSYLPARARRAPESEGRRWQAGVSDFDLVVVLRSYCAPFAFGAVAGTSAAIIVDVDDDDAAFLTEAGQHEEAARYRALLEEISRRAQLVVSVTGFGSTTAVANSVTPAPPRPKDRVPGRRAVMVGNFGYPPNVEGARWFIDEVLPLTHGAAASMEFVIAGPGSEQFVPYGVGFAPDLTGLYSSADAVVVPLLSGSGSRIKAIEAFGAGVAVVGTSVGLAGLDLRAGVDCLMADEPFDFARALVRLLDEPETAARIADNATADVVPIYSRSVVARAADQLLQTCLDHPTTPVLARARSLEVAESHDGVVVTDTATMTVHHLNASAAAVFLLADGSTSAAEMVAELEQSYGASAELSDKVGAAVMALAKAGLIVLRCPRHN